MIGNVDEEQILRDGCAEGSRAISVGEVGGGFKLFAAQAAAEDRCADVAEARRALGMDAGVVAQDVVGNLLGQLMGGLPGSVASGEVGLPVQRDGKVLPCGIYGRWESALSAA